MSDIDQNESELQALFDKTAGEPSEVQWAAMARRAAATPRAQRRAAVIGLAAAALVLPILCVTFLMLRGDRERAHVHEPSAAPNRTVWLDAPGPADDDAADDPNDDDTTSGVDALEID